MDRKGSSVLSGTLLFSLLLSPAVRSSPAPQPASTAEASELDQHSATGNTSGQRFAEYLLPGPKTRQLIEDEARGQYRHDFQSLVQSECRLGDTSPAAPSAKGNPCHLDPSNFIIALVPDPSHTHLALAFDRELDVIEEAVQDDGYLFVRALMPWDAKSHRESDDHVEREETDWDQTAKEDQPGLMIFRKAGNADPTPLLVLVVGETPTQGIRKEQFQNAIGEMQALVRTYGDPRFKRFDAHRGNWKPQDGTPGLRIMGPTFSGSLASLRDLLQCSGSDANKGCYPKVSIHSGTASSWKAIATFAEQAPSLNANFISFQESDQVMVERFLEFFTGSKYGERHFLPERVVVLTEDETAYGTGDAPSSNSLDRVLPSAQDRNWDAYRRMVQWWRPWFSWLPGMERQTPPASSPAIIYFPREISQLRTAYQKDVTQTNSDARSGPRDILPSYTDNPGSDDDTVPNYSLRQAPLSQEAVTLGIVSELQKHHAQYILLRATDSMDMLFLVQYLRNAYPQGRIVTLDADMLFRREAEDPRFHGLLSLSTYSLVPASNHGFLDYERGRAERIFPDSFDAGVYNAMKSLLVAWVEDPAKCSGTEAHDPCYVLKSHQGQSLELYQYGWRQRVNSDAPGYNSPPVHLAALGRDQYWPLADLGPFPGEHYQSRLPLINDQLLDARTRVRIPTSWRVVQVAGLALALFFCFSLWRASIFSSWESFAKFAPAARDRRTTLILINGLTLILILLVLMWPALHGATSGSLGVEPFLLGAAALVFLTTLFEAVDRGLVHRDLNYSCDCRESSRLKPILWIAAFVLACVGLAILVARGESREEYLALVRTFSMQRSTQLSSGLSFIMPTFFFLTVWLWWAGHLCAGYALMDERRPRLPAGMTNKRVLSLTSPSMEKLLCTMRPGAGSFARYLLVMAVIVLSMIVIPEAGDRQHPMMSLERPALEYVMTTLFVMAVAGIVAATIRILQVWTHLRKLLFYLDMLPLRDSFKAIEGFSWKPIWRIGAGSLLEFSRIIAREREALEFAAQTVPAVTSAMAREQLGEKWADLYKEVKAVKAEDGSAPGADSENAIRRWFSRRNSERRIIGLFGSYQEAAARVAGQALEFLAKCWDEQPEGKQLARAAAASYSSGSSLAREREVEAPGEQRLQARACERFVCMSYVTFLLVMLVRLRCLVMAVSGMYVLTLLGISQYPFEPKRVLQLLLAALLVFIISVVGLVFAQIHRDTVLSSLTNTKPGELDIDFYLKMASFVALPLLSLVASQFPSINRLIYSWFQPAVEALNR